MLKRRTFSMLLAIATILGLAGPAIADEVVDGRTGPGSVYRLVRPSTWNGILLLYAHGYVSKDAPVAIPADAELVISLVASQGFAVAVSSFSENGYKEAGGRGRGPIHRWVRQMRHFAPERTETDRSGLRHAR